MFTDLATCILERSSSNKWKQILLPLRYTLLISLETMKRILNIKLTSSASPNCRWWMTLRKIFTPCRISNTVIGFLEHSSCWCADRDRGGLYIYMIYMRSPPASDVSSVPPTGGKYETVHYCPFVPERNRYPGPVRFTLNENDSHF